MTDQPEQDVKSISGLSLARVQELQENYFNSGRTKEYGFRMEQLRRLYAAVVKHESKIGSALIADLGKGKRESIIFEVGLIKHEISYFKKNLRRMMKPKKVMTPLHLMPAKSFVYPEPLGCVLIISPWNYPFYLSMVPLIGAIAAGNCAVMKPSEFSFHCSELMGEIISETFPEEYVTTFLGGQEVGSALTNASWDHLFYTGSTAIGSKIAQAAGKSLTPVTLELGGKSPCIVCSSANLEISARRIAFGKLANSGQSCVAPDYIIVDQTVKDEFLKHLKAEFQKGMGSEREEDYSYGRIINQKHYERLEALKEGQKVLWQGPSIPENKYMAPCIIEPSDLESPIMKEEIFGPLLPILTFDSLDEAFSLVRSKPKPLSAYLFTEDEREVNRFLSSLSFGGGCINDTIVHLGNNQVSFGGVGPSGVGGYHGKHSFDTFSHKKSMVQSYTKWDLPVRYSPFPWWKEFLLKIFLR